MATHRSLGTRAVRGVLWTGSASVFQLGAIMVLYKLLDTGDMGRFEYALILVMFLALIGDLGLSNALVQRRAVDDTHFDTAFWTNAAWGLTITSLMLAAAPLIAALLQVEKAPEFTRALRILCLLIPFASVSGIFRARLQRDLDFSAVALSEAVSVFAFGIVVVPLVFLAPDLGVLVPLIGSVVREAGLLLSLGWSARWVPGWRFRPQALRQLLSFALNFTGARAIAYLNSNIASLYIFPILGEVAQGYYRMAERLTLQPLIRLSTTITRVSFPTFSAIQDDDALLRQGYLRSVQGLVLFMGPLLAGLFVFASELLEYLENTPALTVLRLLAAATILKVMGTMVGSIFMAKDKANWSFYWSIFSLAVLVPSMYFCARYDYGIEGIAALIAASSLLFLLLSQALANRLIGLTFTAYLTALVRPFLVVLAVFAVLTVIHPFLPGPPLIVLIQGIILALLIYLLALRLLAWNLCRTYWRSLRGRSHPDAS